MSQSTSKISLSFSKKIEKRSLKISAIGNDNFKTPEAEDKHSISSFDKSTKLVEPTKPDEVVIPLIESTRDAIFEKLEKKSKNEDLKSEEIKSQTTDLSLDEQAAAAVLKECSQKLEKLKNEQTENGLSIKVILDDNLDENVPVPNDSGEVSTLENYEQVNVDCFGAAMLRGMGWNTGKGIGKHNKIIEIVTPTNKTFGQIDTDRIKKKDVVNSEEEEELKKGSQILIHSGRNKGTYGVVESIDEDHLLIRPTKGEHVLREVEQNLHVVSAKEFKEISRLINKEMYDKFKAAEEKKKGKEDLHKAVGTKNSKKRKKGESEREFRDKRYENEDHKSDKKYFIEDKHRTGRKERRESSSVDKDRSAERDQDQDRVYRKATKEHFLTKKKYDHSHKKDVNKETEVKGAKSDRKEGRVGDQKISKTKIRSDKPAPPIPMIPWAQENLRVRIIDKQYQQGIYHKQKVLVRCVETVNNCTCVCDDGRILYDVNPDNLETVIPKVPLAVVLVVKGKYKGQKGRILELDKYKEEATLQFFFDNSILAKLHYDDICEVAR